MKEYKVGDQPCLTDPAVYETVLKNVRAWLDSNRNATIISVSPNDSYTNQAGCRCANCKALDDQYGSPMGSLLTFVNRIARDIREDYPQVYVETLAYHYTQTPPVGLVAEDNVLIRLCPSACCMVHGIAGCEQGDTFRADLTAWSKICKTSPSGITASTSETICCRSQTSSPSMTMYSSTCKTASSAF